MYKTIIITWTDKRSWMPAWEYNQPKAVLWCDRGTDTDLNNALEYARKAGADYKVHTFAPDERQWRAKAIAAHRLGCSA